MKLANNVNIWSFSRRGSRADPGFSQAAEPLCCSSEAQQKEQLKQKEETKEARRTRQKDKSENLFLTWSAEEMRRRRREGGTWGEEEKEKENH